MTAVAERFELTVHGRPAPQGSKKTGSAGQLREASAYLPAWRAAVKKAAAEWMRANGVAPEDRPLFRGPVGFSATFRMPPGRRVDAPPDLDKLLRAVWDALTQVGVWEDDGRVVQIDWLDKRHADEGEPTGADIVVRTVQRITEVEGDG